MSKQDDATAKKKQQITSNKIGKAEAALRLRVNLISCWTLIFLSQSTSGH